MGGEKVGSVPSTGIPGDNPPELPGGESCSGFALVISTGPLVALTFGSAPRTGLIFRSRLCAV